MLPLLQKFASDNSLELSTKLTDRWELEVESVDSNSSNFSIEKVLDIIDKDRMDILSTLIRVSLHELNMDVSDGILFLRSWEKLVREQLAQVKGPGQLFSPLEIPEGF